MQISTFSLTRLLLCLAGAVCACLLYRGALAFQLPSPELADGVYQVRLRAEQAPAEAVEQLNRILHDLPPKASVADRRLVLSTLTNLYLHDGQYDDARKQIVALRNLATRANDNYALALAMNYEAAILVDQTKLDEAKQLNERALELAKTINSNPLTRQLEGTLSAIASDQGDFSAALQYELAALARMDSNDQHDDLDRIDGLNAISVLYINLKDPAMALDYLDKASALANASGAKRELGRATLNRGVAYEDLDRYEDAIKSFLQAQRSAHEVADPRIETLAVNNLADAYYHLNRFDLCLRYAKRTVELSEHFHNDDFRTTGQINVGLCHMGLGETALGAREVNQGIEVVRKEGAKTSIEQLYGQLAAAYEHVGMYREAYHALEEEFKISTEIFKSDRDRAVSEMKARYDASEREKQIVVLEQKNQVQSVELRNKGLQRIIAILATAIALSVAITILVLYRQVRKANRNLEEANIKLAHQSTRDPLTGLYNRRAFHDAMKFRSKQSDRRSNDIGDRQAPHAFVMLDIDHFKRINDSYGHASGDAVLIELSRRLSHVMRDKDMLMRWGGEEFLVFLHHIPNARLAQVMERILISIGSRPVEFERHVIPVTISAGFIALPAGLESDVDQNWEKMLNLADSGLYMAKTRGRNQAIGLKLVNVGKDELDALSAGGLDQAIQEGRVVVESIAGPPQNEAVAEY